MAQQRTEYRFTKMHGLGNDFIILDQRDGSASLSTSKIKTISHRRTGIGCDQFIHIKPPQSVDAVARLEMYNSDGQHVGACGNGTRCVASYLMKDLDIEKLSIETDGGLLHARAASINKAEVTVDMGKPVLDWGHIPLLRDVDILNVHIDESGLDPAVAVGMGNPHIVFFVDDVAKVHVEAIGPVIEYNSLFPKRTNVEFVQRMNENTLRMRVWERGVGVTSACGTGACATVVAAVLRGIANRKTEVVLDGGSLFINWREEDDHVLMTGPATYVCDGTFEV